MEVIMSNFQVNGINLFYEVKGDLSSIKTVAFFNGVMASTNSWDLIWPIFERLGYKVILHDFKGQLKSDKPEGPYTFDEHCSEANALFEFLGIEHIHIIGTSYGGEIAMKFAMNHPEMTKSISVIDSVSELDAVIIQFLKGWTALCDSNDGKNFFYGMMPSIYGPKYIEEQADFLSKRAEAVASLPKSYYDGQKILYETFLNNTTMTDSLNRITCPVLIICGEEDLLKRPKFSRIIAEKIPHSEFFLLPECGHVAIFEKPEELKSVLMGFVVKNDFTR